MEAKISYRQWRANLWMYVVGSMLAAISAGVTSVDFSSPKHVVAFVAGVLSVGVLQAKGYTGRASEVEPKIEEKPTQLQNTGPK